MPELTILYQDEYIVAVDKPSGLLVHKSMLDKHETEFALQTVRDQIGQRVFPVHRLDRPTSGVLVFALSSDVARLLGEQFFEQRVEKHYLALVRGHVNQAGEVLHPLKEKLDKIADKLANKNKAPQAAHSLYQPLAQFELPYAVGRYPSTRYSLVHLNPKTGRKHQLRRHMAHINHPILGDTTHGDGKHNAFVRDHSGLHRLALYCQSMAFLHPITNTPLHIRCRLDSQLLAVLQQWGAQPSAIEQLHQI